MLISHGGNGVDNEDDDIHAFIDESNIGHHVLSRLPPMNHYKTVLRLQQSIDDG
jgi:hypothetical protein